MVQRPSSHQQTAHVKGATTGSLGHTGAEKGPTWQAWRAQGSGAISLPIAPEDYRGNADAARQIADVLIATFPAVRRT